MPLSVLLRGQRLTSGVAQFSVVGISAMSFELRNEKGDSFRFSNSGWGFYLNLAEEYGWTAAGTLPPENMGQLTVWPKTYDSNDGQWVSARDAAELARALQRALDDPKRAERASAVARARSEAVRIATGRSYEIRVEGDDTSFIREVIGFFQKGRFQIL